MRPTITVKLKPYLQEFLICKLGEAATNATPKHVIGAIIAPMLEYAGKEDLPRYETGQQCITFELPNCVGGKNIRSYSVFMPPEKQEEFQRILSLYFKDVFYQYVNDKLRYEKQIKKCILSFCTFYNITFNKITYEMLKKSYYRYKKKKKIPVFFA